MENKILYIKRISGKWFQEKRNVLIFLFLLSFAVRFIFILMLKNQLYFDDEYEYLKIVNNFLSGNGLIVAENLKSYRPPLFPFFLSFFCYLKFNLFGIRIIQAVISSFTTVFIYLTGRKVFSEKIGWVSGIISCFYPFFIFYTGFLLTETLFIFLVVVTLYQFVKIIEEKNVLTSMKAGFSLGLAGLCRPTMQLFLPVSFFQILSIKEEMKMKLKKIFILIIVFALTLSPWIIRNYKIFHRFIPGTTMGGWVFWEGNNPYSVGGPCHYFPENILSVEEIKRDKTLYHMAFQVIKENPKRFVWLLKNKFFRFWNVIPNAKEYTKSFYRILSVASFGIMLPFFVLGFVLSLRNKKAQFFHSLIILFTLSHMIFLASIRYRVAIEPFYIILAVYGFFWMVKQIKNLWFQINTNK